MPVTVSLESLVTTPNTLSLWPEKFRGLMAKLEENPDEPTAWLVLADWLQEHDEKEMESTCRWIAKRIPLGVTIGFYRGVWSLGGVPDAIRAGNTPPGDLNTLAGAVAGLTVKLRVAREALA
jgi:uncharacterized protein (TIGR02996 family)